MQITQLHRELATPRQLEYLEAVEKAGSMRKAANLLGVSHGTISRAIGRLMKSSGSSQPAPSYQFPEQEIVSDRLVITWAQNATPVFKPFLRSINTYCEDMDAQLLVIPGRYKNPTSTWSSAQDDHEWWDDAIAEYLCDHEIKLARSLRLMAHAKIQPTAINPLSGMQTMGEGDSLIYGHPQIAQETVPTPQNKLAKMVSTTGAITRPNYTDSKAGLKGDYHHEYGALIVELDGDVFHIRHIVADGSGKFYDFDRLYNGDKVTKGHRAEFFVSGDLHAKFIDTQVKEAWWTGKDALLKRIRPKAQVFHDVLDGYFGSHHHERDPFLKVGKFYSGDDDGQSEIQQLIDTLNDLMICDKNYIAQSNHDEHLDRWLKESDWRKDLRNAELYLELALEGVRAAKAGKPFSALECAAKSSVPKATFLSRSKHLNIKGYALSYHGDKGPNGARGSRKAFDKIGCKSVIGHSHSPGREKGCIQVGISCVYGLEYAKGSPSSWMQSGCIGYPNGKATLINCINGRYALED